MNFATYDKEYVIGIDLHGTLLNEDWLISSADVTKLIEILEQIKRYATILIITGNDLHFVQEHVPESLYKLIDGFILENGVVFSDGVKEITIATKEEIEIIKSLEKELKAKQDRDILFFARRLGSISMFTRNKSEGVLPNKLYSKIVKLLENHPVNKQIFVTHSDVAVDIVPFGYTKWTAIEKMFDDKKIIAIADSYNDWDFLFRADHPFMPNNCSPKIEEAFAAHNKKVLPMTEYKGLNPQSGVFKSALNNTAGVIEILEKLIINFKKHK